jgi:hypothetical protein
MDLVPKILHGYFFSYETLKHEILEDRTNHYDPIARLVC